MKDLIQLPNPNDKDAKYIHAHKGDLMFQSTIYFDKNPEELREMFNRYPDFFVTEKKVINYKQPNFWEKHILGKKLISPKTTYKDNLVNCLFGRNIPTSLVNPIFFDFGITNFKLDFDFKGALHDDYLSPENAEGLIPFYQKRKPLFDELKLEYLGVITCEGSDDNEDLDDALERLNKKYKIFNTEFGIEKIFMSSATMENNNSFKLK